MIQKFIMRPETNRELGRESIVDDDLVAIFDLLAQWDYEDKRLLSLGDRLES